MTIPEIASDSYGTVEGVAALAHTWTTDDSFWDADAYTEATNPSLTTVINWINQISAILNTALQKYGFTVPLVTDRAKLNAASIVEELVAGRVPNQITVDPGTARFAKQALDQMLALP